MLDTYEVQCSGPLTIAAFSFSSDVSALWYRRPRYGEWVWHLIAPSGMMTPGAEDKLRVLDGVISVHKLTPLSSETSTA